MVQCGGQTWTITSICMQHWQNKPDFDEVVYCSQWVFMKFWKLYLDTVVLLTNFAYFNYTKVYNLDWYEWYSLADGHLV